MIRLLYGCDDFVTRWVADRIPHVRQFGPAAGIGFLSDQRIVGGIVYHDYQEDFGSIQISMASENPMWARPAVIAKLLAYPFGQLGVWSVFTMTHEENYRALRVNEHIGFKRKTIIPHAFGKKRHAVFCQMTEPTFREKYGALANVLPAEHLLTVEQGVAHGI